MILFSVSLIASPSINEIMAMVNTSPELLNTPQAKAMMEKEGLSVDDVKSKLDLLNGKKKQNGDDLIINDLNTTYYEDLNATDLNITDNNNTEDKDKNKDENETELLNPFIYKSAQELKKEILKLQLKQEDGKEHKLKRFSQTFFLNANTLNSSSTPTPDNYVLSTGDELSIYIYGSKDKTLDLTINSDGTVQFPYIGPIKVGGLEFAKAKKIIESKLKKIYKGNSFAISISKYNPIQVILVGDVKYPGVYNLTSFSTVKDLLIAAKGIRDDASIRDIEIKRAGKTFANVDLYSLLIDGDTSDMKLLQNGDVVVVKKASILVSVDGYVSNPAIYELKKDEKLDKAIEFAGGLNADASKYNIKIQRFIDNDKIDNFELSLKDVKKYRIRNGDKIYIYPLDSLAKNSITLFGNVIRPGEYNIANSSLTNFFKKNLKNGYKNFFLPKTYFKYAVIKRYSKNLNYETISFNLKDVIDGKKDLKLLANDELYIYSEDDIESSKFVKTIGQNLINPGPLLYYKGMTLKDAINASGIIGIIDDKVRVTTYHTEDKTPKTTFYSFSKDGDVKLYAYDEIEVYDYYTKNSLEPISIKGEVVVPLETSYENGMTLKSLIDMAGGFTKMAYTKRVEIVRSYIDKDQSRRKKVLNIDLTKQSLEDVKLKPYDDVTIFKIPKWNEKKVVILKGEVKFPGEYVIENGERLASVLKRAGGFTEDAFVYGAVFTRESIRLNQIEQYNRSLARIKRELAMYNSMPANVKQSSNMQNISATLNEVMSEAQKYQPIGRVSIEIDKDLDKFEKSEYNIVLEDKDTITIPTQKDTVTVFGEVFNPTSFIYNSDLSAEDYIEMASGLSRSADEDSIYVIHADGTSEPIKSGWWIFASSVEIKKGDTIVAPVFIKEDRYLDIWSSIAKIMSSFAITAASLNTLGLL